MSIIFFTDFPPDDMINANEDRIKRVILYDLLRNSFAPAIVFILWLQDECYERGSTSIEEGDCV